MKHYIIDEIKSTNNHSIIFGEKQSGKTFAAKLEIIRHLNECRKVFVFDFQDRYEAICNQYEGNKITIQDGQLINIFDYRPKAVDPEEKKYNLTSHILKLWGFIQIILDRKVEDNERKIIINALEKYYHSFQIINNFETFLNHLKEESYALYIELTPYVEHFSTSPQKNLFKNRFTVLNLKLDDVKPNIKNSIIFSLLHFVRMDNRETLSKSSVVFESVRTFFENEIVYDVLLMQVKTAKKFDLHYMFTEESFTKFVNNEGENLLANVSTTMLLKQEPKDAEMIKEYYSLWNSRYGNRMDKLPLSSAVVVNNGVCDIWLRP